MKSGAVEPAQEAFAFLSAQRFFIASDSLFLPAGVSPPRLFGAAGLGDNLLDRRFAQRRFIASDKRRRPSGVMPLRLLRATYRVGPLAFKPAPSRRAVIARCIFSLSRFNSAMILSSSVPLGYDLSDHRLVVNAAEAEKVRLIFHLYLELKTLRRVRDELDRKSIVSKQWESRGGVRHRGFRFRRGALYHLLANPIYMGEIRHKKVTYPGQHEPIIERAIWSRSDSWRRR